MYSISQPWKVQRVRHTPIDPLVEGHLIRMERTAGVKPEDRRAITGYSDLQRLFNDSGAWSAYIDLLHECDGTAHLVR